MELTETESMALERAARLGRARTGRFYRNMLGVRSEVYQGASESLGPGFTINGDGETDEPEGGFWKAGMPVASAPIRD
jgi:hypothetical protein